MTIKVHGWDITIKIFLIKGMDLNAGGKRLFDFTQIMETVLEYLSSKLEFFLLHDVRRRPTLLSK